MAVELGGVEVGDVEGEDDDGGVAGGGAEGAELLDVADVIAAALGGARRRARGGFRARRNA